MREDRKVERRSAGRESEIQLGRSDRGNDRYLRDCETCGLYRTELEVTIESQVSSAHRGGRHELESELEPGWQFASRATGYLVKIHCSRAALQASGLLMLRRGN